MRFLLLPFLAVTLLPSALFADPAPLASCLTTHIRPTPDWVAPVLCAARRRSTTLRRVLEQIEATDLVVYVVEAGGRRRGWDGRTRFLSYAAGHRYVLIEVRPQIVGAEAAALLSHELQHALEIAQAKVTSRAEMERLFRRVGIPSDAAGTIGFDTAAAIRTGVDTLRDLTGRRVVLSPRAAMALRRDGADHIAGEH